MSNAFYRVIYLTIYVLTETFNQTKTINQNLSIPVNNLLIHKDSIYIDAVILITEKKL